MGDSWLQGEQVSNCTVTDGVYVLPLLDPQDQGQVTITAVDGSGNTRTVSRTFRQGAE